MFLSVTGKNIKHILQGRKVWRDGEGREKKKDKRGLRVEEGRDDS
jgi:hypothetical protein